MVKSTVPMMLNIRWMIVARLALRLVPMEARTAVIQVPIFWPKRMNTELEKLMAPLVARAWRMPTEAEEDWIRAVNRAPTAMPSRGLENLVIRSTKAWESRRGIMEELIISMPINSTPRPAMIWPMWWALGILTKTTMATPMKAKRGARAPTSRAISCPVIVVPILAPMMIQTAWFRVIIPELTKPTTMTVVAEEDWITAVMPAPTRTPRKRLAVSRSRISFILLPAAASRPELIICMPYRNSARPPKRLRRPETDIGIPPSINTASAERSETKGMEKA